MASSTSCAGSSRSLPSTFSNPFSPMTTSCSRSAATRPSASPTISLVDTA